MKFHWGIGVAVVIVIFAIGVGILVYIASSQKVDLVSDDYYQQELNHQERIDETKRSADINKKVTVNISNSELKVIFPDFFQKGKLKGTNTLYRPSDRNNDIVIPLMLDSLNTQTILTTSFIKGLWRLKINWKYEKEKYYQEEVVIIQ